MIRRSLPDINEGRRDNDPLKNALTRAGPMTDIAGLLKQIERGDAETQKKRWDTRRTQAQETEGT